MPIPPASPGQVRPEPGEPREQVLELRQLHLELAFPALGALREDVQDKLRAVDDPEIQGRLQVPLLGRGEVVVEDDQVRTVLLGEGVDLRDLAGAHQGGGMEARPRSG